MIAWSPGCVSEMGNVMLERATVPMPYNMCDVLGGPGTCQQNARRFSHLVPPLLPIFSTLSTVPAQARSPDHGVMRWSERTPLNALEDIDGAGVNKRFTAGFGYRRRATYRVE
jgi:hypothetical protein